MAKVSINTQKGRLYLLCRLPPRNDQEAAVRQQRVALGLDDTPTNRKVAERRRVELQRQVDRGTFAWEDWVEPSQGVTWRKAIDLLYRKRVINGRTGESTWAISYMGRLRQLPMSTIVTSSGIKKALQKYQRASCSYKELYYLLTDLCSLVPVKFPELPVPTYGSKVSSPDVPSDDYIVDFISKLESDYAWSLGMIATYGLRPHEIDQCKFLDKNRLEVADDTKTGARIVIPYPSDWVELFGLKSVKRHVPASAKKDSTSKWLSKQHEKHGFSYKTYSLRHAYAGRLWRARGSKLDIYTASRLMGHNVKEHERTYRAWITPYTIAEKAEELLYGFD